MPESMSSSPDFSENRTFSGRMTVKTLEKSNFSQTCNLLSQYLKEKGSFGDLSLGMTCTLEGKGKPETFRQTASAMNLLPMMETSGEVSDRNATPLRNVKSMGFFPPEAKFGGDTFVSTENVSKKADLWPAKTESETAQMTIFYAGKVLVFNDFPADKAKELMIFASKGSSQISGNFTSTSNTDNLNSGNFTVSTLNYKPNSDNIQKSSKSRVSDLPMPMPIARKASLHRFLERRKDRITAKAPYQVSETAETPGKPEESKAWLGLASQSS